MTQTDPPEARINQAGASRDFRSHPPAMSIVLPVDQPESIRGVLEKLRGQTIAARLEIVLATPAPAAFESFRVNQTDFQAVKVIALGDLSSLGEARAQGVQAASAACVFLGETHSFPSVPDWAERLVARHSEGWAVVVPGFRNANPAHTLSWAGFLLDYGGWTEHAAAGEIDYWPLNNSACDRAAILGVPGDPGHALSYGDQLILALRAAGHRVYFEPRAVLSHLNIRRWKNWLDERWVGGRLIARHRSRDWPLAQRWAYVAAAPLIGLVLFSRVARPAWRTLRKLDLSPAILPAMLLGSMTQAIGELAGYSHLGGFASSERRMTEYELHKVCYT